MCTQVRFHCYDIPNHVLEHLLDHQHGNEVLMHVNAPKASLLIEHQGSYQWLPWGNKKEPQLPKTGFCKEESLREGKWQWLHPQQVRIVASAAWANGVWFQVKVGIHGLLIQDSKGQRRVYMLTREATHYYSIMTGSKRMPALMDQIL